MAANAGAIFAGIGQDLVTGTVLSAPYGTPLPVVTQAFFEATLDSAFVDSGYIADKGVALNTSRKFFDIKDMDGSILDSLQDEFDGTIKTTFLELNQNTLGNLFGSSRVTVTPSTTTAGNRSAVVITGEGLDPESWVFRMKAGRKRVGIVVPRGRLTDQGDVTYTSSGAASVDVTIKTIPVFDSGAGINVNCYIITDDGIWSLSLIPSVASVLPSGAAAAALVTIVGTRFTGTVATTGVKFGGVNAAAFTIVNDSTIVAELPAGSAGSAAVVVTNASGSSTSFAYTRA